MSKGGDLVDEVIEEVEELVEEAEWPPRSRKARKITLAITAIFALVLVGVWTQRKPIARNFVQNELDERGVAASYDITEIGFRTQRLENLVIGDPKNPDLTARWAEVIVRIGFGGAKLSSVRASGVRLNGRLVDGTFTFGAVDKLLPEPTGEPFTLPDIRVDLSDARMRLALPNGVIGLAIEGRGNLSNGFRGKLAASAPALQMGDCALTRTSAGLDLSITDKRPRVAGPVRAASFRCAGGGGLALDAPQAVVEARFSEALNQWQGSAGIEAGAARLGANRLAQILGTIGFDGRKAETRGDIRLAAQSLVAAGMAGQGLALRGSYHIGSKPQGVAMGLSGHAAIERTALDAQSLASITAFGKTGAGTPLAPLTAAASEATVRAARDASIDAGFTVAHLGSAGMLHITALSADSRSGARIRFGGGRGVSLAWPGAGSARVDGQLSLRGGGLPDAMLALRQRAPGEPIEGVATIRPYAAGGARLVLAPVRFGAAGRGATRFDTRVTIDGPLADGRVTGLTLPVAGSFDANGNVRINPACAPLSFNRLSLAGMDLGTNRASLCPYAGPALFARDAAGRISGGARISGPRLAGRVGNSPLSIAADNFHFAFAKQVLGVENAAIRLGQGGDATRLDIARIDGAGRGGGLGGRFAGVAGKIANVPLLVSEGAGGWTFAKGALELSGGLRVADAEANARFNPLVSENFALALRDGRIAANGKLRHPASKADVADVEITHELGAGKGKAQIDVANLRFGEGLQPDSLTPIALGVVANVRGVVTGRGEIRWSSEGVTSDGVFRTQNTDLAAAFGPVTAATGELRFTDLLGLVSAPGQRMYLGELNPGIAVLNGYIDYQLIPDQKVRIEGGRWPFAGGELILEPTVLDFGVEKERRLTFRVEGLDAAQFINQFELKDINVTGIFDGTIPMIFDDTGGRIEGGRLVVREAGGTLAYVGQVSNENLGTFGSMAFDALKSIKYNRLGINLNGPLDGEMVTEVRFTGTNQGTVDVAAGSMTRQFMGLPFIFNITIKAPFRGLLNTARSFTDPSLLIRQNLPGFEAADPPQPVQPKESETMR